MQGVRLPVITALLGVTLAAGCTSSGGSTPTSPPPTSHQPVSTPAPTTPSQSQTPVGLPIAPSPVPIKRTLTRPPGAAVVDRHTCGVPLDEVAPYLKNQVFVAPDVSLQLSQLPGAGRLAASERREIRKARRVWLRDGYPAGFPTVRDLDNYIAVLTRTVAAARAGSLDPLPRLYLQLEKINAQYLQDSGPTVCQQ